MPRLHVLDFGRNTVHDNYNYDIFYTYIDVRYVFDICV